MGGTISKIRDEISGDNADEKKKQLDDAMQALEYGVDTRFAKFYEDIETNVNDPKLIPMKHITGKFSFIQCKVQQDSADFAKQIQDLIKDVAGGDWAAAVSDAAAAIIQDLLGNSESSMQEQQKYLVTMDPIGGISRLDVLFMSYSFESQALVTVAQNMVACYVVKSSIDLSQMDDNTLRIIIDDSFSGLSNTTKVQLYEAMAPIVLPIPPTEAAIKATEELEELWKTVDPKQQPKALNPRSHVGNSSLAPANSQPIIDG